MTYNAQGVAVASEQCVTITETSLKNITLVNFLIILILIIVVAANINEGKSPNDDYGDCSSKYLLANNTNMSTDKFSLVKRKFGGKESKSLIKNSGCAAVGKP